LKPQDIAYFKRNTLKTLKISKNVETFELRLPETFEHKPLKPLNLEVSITENLKSGNPETYCKD
jgi:hypothetical protein